MFNTKEIKDVVHNFPDKGRSISNPVVAHGLIPSESKDGFVQVQAVQEGLKRAIESDTKRLSISLFASAYDVNRNVVLELLHRSYPDIVWSRDQDEVLSISEQRHLKERLNDCSLDQFVEVDKFLLKHDIHDSFIATIDTPPFLMETIDYGGEKYLHSEQLIDKVIMYIRGRLSKAEQHKEVIKILPGDLPGHPPLSLIFTIVKELCVEGGEQVLEVSGVEFTPGSYKRVLSNMELSKIRSGRKLYADTSSISSIISLPDISCDEIKVYGQYLVSSLLLKQISMRLKTLLLSTGYTHVPMFEGYQTISQVLHNIIVLDLTEIYEQSNFKYNYPYIYSCSWFDSIKEELFRVVDFSLQTRWDFTPALEPLDDMPNTQELTRNSNVLDGMPIDLFDLLLSTDLRNIVKDQHAMKLRSLKEESDHKFNAFWLQQVSATIEAFVQALLKVKSEKLRNQLSVTLAVYIKTTLVPKAIAKAFAQRLVRRGDLAEELSKLENDLKPMRPPASCSAAANSHTENVFNYFLESSIEKVVSFSAQFNIPHVSSWTLHALRCLMCFSTSSPMNSSSSSPSPSPSPSRPSSISPAELSFGSTEIPSIFLEAHKVALFEDLRYGMVNETDDARLFLKMLIILFARRHQVMIYATGKAAPKLLKELLYLQKVDEEGDKEKRNEVNKEQQQQVRKNDDNDTVTGLRDEPSNGDPTMGIDSTSAGSDTNMAHDHNMEDMKEDQDPDSPAELETASPSQQQSNNSDIPLKEKSKAKVEDKVKAQAQAEENFISFTPPQHKYSIPISSNNGNKVNDDNDNDNNNKNKNKNMNNNSSSNSSIPDLDFDIHSSEFSNRMDDLKDKVKTQTITDDDRMYMRNLAGVVDRQSGKLLLSEQCYERGKWTKKRNYGANDGWKEGGEEELEIENWFRVRSERGFNLLRF